MNPQLIDDTLKRVKILLGITGSDKDDLLTLYIEIVGQRILNYCNIYIFPKELELTLAQMVMDIYKEMLATSTAGEIIEGSGKVASISEGGRTVTFDVKAQMMNPALLAAKAADKIPLLTELNRFKQLYRIKPKED